MLSVSFKSLTKSLAIVLALSGFAAVASAGASLSPDVVVVGSTTARGGMRAARNSSDSQQYIGCTLRHIEGNTRPVVMCSARDSAGRSLSCSSTDPVQGLVVASIGPDSHIYFEVRNGYLCTEIDVVNDSRYLDGPAPRPTAPTAGAYEAMR